MTRVREPRARWEGLAPAKVNLFLRVLAREEGGYHQLETLFQSLELADGLSLELLETPAQVTLELVGVEAGALGPVEENLAVRAARGVLEHPALQGSPLPGVHIRLEKRIPHGAGLGGGSSDAATVLEGVNALLGSPLDLAERVRLGGSLGADVPFFLTGAARALAWGRGDRILPLPSLPSAEILLVLPPWGIPTPRAYQSLAQWRAAQGAEPPPSRVWSTGGGPGVAFPTWEAQAQEAENAFAEALVSDYPELEQLRLGLLKAGATLALLSGSGSAVFGVFPEGIPEGLGTPEVGIPGAEIPGLRIFRTRTRS